MDALALTNIVKTDEGPTIKELVPLFLSEEDISAASKKTYKFELSRFTKFLENKGIKYPVKADLVAYKEELCNKYKASTVNLNLSVVKKFFKWTHFYGMYPDVTFGIKNVREDKSPKRQPLSSTQVKGILDNIDTSTFRGCQKYALVLLASTTGLRVAEISGLDVSDLQILQDSPVLLIKGKGHIDKGQIVQIGPECDKAIRKALSFRKNLKPNDPVFISTSNYHYGSRITPKGIGKLLKKILEENYFTGPFYTAHSFRHSSCCLALDGHDLISVKNFMRHENLETTLIYADHIEILSCDIARDIERKLFGKN